MKRIEFDLKKALEGEPAFNLKGLAKMNKQLKILLKVAVIFVFIWPFLTSDFIITLTAWELGLILWALLTVFEYGFYFVEVAEERVTDD